MNYLDRQLWSDINWLCGKLLPFKPFALTAVRCNPFCFLIFFSWTKIVIEFLETRFWIGKSVLAVINFLTLFPSASCFSCVCFSLCSTLSDLKAYFYSFSPFPIFLPLGKVNTQYSLQIVGNFFLLMISPYRYSFLLLFSLPFSNIPGTSLNTNSPYLLPLLQSFCSYSLFLPSCPIS